MVLVPQRKIKGYRPEFHLWQSHAAIRILKKTLERLVGEIGRIGRRVDVDRAAVTAENALVGNLATWLPGVVPCSQPGDDVLTSLF